MIPVRFHFLLFIFLVLGFIPFMNAVKKECRMDDNGIKYVDYKGDCEIGGYEEFLKQYKDLEDIQVHKAIVAFNCKLCDPRQQLECYKKLIVSNETNSTQETSAKADVKEVGECDCLSTHQDGYIFVYDKAANQCRGGVNSTCDLSVVCHTSLKCEVDTCLCPEENGCKDVPSPRLLPEYESNGAVRLSSYQNHGPFIYTLLISIFFMKDHLKYFILGTK